MKKNTVVGSIVIILLIVTIIIIHKSSALYKINDQHNFINSKVNFFVSKDFSYTGSSQEFIVPHDGYYNIELWGARGGNGYSTYINTGNSLGGKGGYTKGLIKLDKNEKIYFYIGKSGSNATTVKAVTDYLTNGGYNGGGSGAARNNNSYVHNAGSGGGASDVRLISGSWNNSVSLRSRIMVAAAGGGGSGHEGLAVSGYGGGLIGGSGYNTSGQWAKNSGAVQTATGTTTNSTAYPGSFGIGGNGIIGNGSAGAGGGYYGGTSGYWGSGSGGSSYISGYAGVNSVLESGGTAAAPLHSNNTLHYSNKYFINGSMQNGINDSDGKAKITYVGNIVPSRTNIKLNNVRYVKSCLNGNTVNLGNHWVEIQIIKNGINLALGKIPVGTVAQISTVPYTNATDGKMDNATGTTNHATSSIEGLQCITVDLGAIYDLDEIGLWNYWAGGRTYYQNTLSIGDTNVAGTTSLSTVLHTYSGTSGYAETTQGKRYTAWD